MLHQLAHQVTLWLHDNPEWGGIVAFIVALTESLAIIGIFIPALIIFTAIGALVSSGVLPLMPILLWTFLGAIIGDGGSYLIGYYYHQKLQRIWPFNKYHNLLNKGKRYFTKHGGKSVFISRFVGPLRSIMPIVAGMMNMRPRKFFAVNIPSAIIWAPFYMSGGFLLGAAANSISPGSGQHFTVVIVIALLAITLLFFLMRWLIVWLNNHLHDQMMKVASLQRVFFNAIDFNHAQQTFLGLWGIVCLILFLTLVLLIIGHIGIDMMNLQIHHFFQGDRNQFGDNFFLAIALLGQPQILLSWAAVIIIALFISKNVQAAKYFLGLLLLAAALIYLFKTITHYPSPNPNTEGYQNFSFPSSHLVFSICVYGLLSHLIVMRFERRYHYWAFSVISILIFMISISQLYLGIDWLTDVIGSALLGCVLVLIAIIAYRRKATAKIKLRWFLPLLIISFALFYGGYTWLHYTQLLSTYQVVPLAKISVITPPALLV